MRTVLELEELANLAIKAALAKQWQDAVRLNQEYLGDQPESIEASNRLARAYQELGDLDGAKKTYKRVLTLDPYNPIAQKNLEKLLNGAAGSSSMVSPELFLEEPGKTRIAVVAQPQQKRLAQLIAGEELVLEERNHRLVLLTKDGHVVGHLPEELTSHLLNLIHLGNTYTAHLMSTSAEHPQVFLREKAQSTRSAKFISFTRQHVLTHQSEGKEMLPSDESLPLEGGNDESNDDWENDSHMENEDLDSDDFNSVSLEGLRDEEDDTYRGRDRDDY